MAGTAVAKKPGKIDDDTFMTAAEVAARLRVSPRAVYKMVAQGRLPAFRSGEAVRISRKVVDGLVARAEAGEAVRL